MVLLTTLRYVRSPNGAIHSDFGICPLVGRLALQGQLESACYADRFWQLQHDHWGAETRFLWSYPPQFDFVAIALALAPSWLAYLVFTGLGLTAYLLVLRSLAGASFPVVPAAVFPVLP